MNLDQFYTNPNTAERFYNILSNKVDFELFDIFLEPSAGKGAFFNLFPINKRIGLDLEPNAEHIIYCDFFDFIPMVNTKYIVIGNPPFGRQSKNAIRFFQYASTFADVIAFILPRTFNKISIQNKLNLQFHLLYSETLPLKPCCFTPKMSAKCVFQIWIKKNVFRTPITFAKTHNDFSFLKYGPKDIKNQPTPPNGADFAMKAYGSNCGILFFEDLNTLRPKSYHWIKSNINTELLINRFNQLDYSMSLDTVRQNSLCQKELIYLYSNSFD